MKSYLILLLFAVITFSGCSERNFRKAYQLNKKSEHFLENKYFVNKEDFGAFFAYSHTVFFKDGSVFHHGTTDTIRASIYMDNYKKNPEMWGYYSKTDSTIKVFLFKQQPDYYAIIDKSTLIDTLQPSNLRYEAKYKLSPQKIDTVPNHIWNKKG